MKYLNEMNRREAGLSVAGLMLFSATDVASAEGRPPVLPIADFVHLPELRSPSFSPDGSKIAARVLSNGRLQLVVTDLSTKITRQLTQLERSDVVQAAWISNVRLIVGMADAQSGSGVAAGWSEQAVDFDGGQPRSLSAWRGISSRDGGVLRFNFYQSVPGTDDDIFATTQIRGSNTPDLVRVNTRTGRYVNLTEDNPGRVHRWVIDPQGGVRAAMGRSADLTESIFWFRDTPTSKWQEVQRQAIFDRETIPVQFGPDGTLYVLSNQQTDTFAVYRWNTQEHRLGEQLFRHARCDIRPLADADDRLGGGRSPLLMDPVSGEILGLSIMAEKPEILWFDNELAAVQSKLDASLPAGSVNIIRRLGAGKFLVRNFSDVDPGATFLYEESAGKLRELVRVRPRIKPDWQAEMKVLRFKARDGLEIPAYLTLPRGLAPRRLPLVVWVHGGPWSRDLWGWSTVVQFLANRGYAVLQPNFRSSAGLGFKHLNAGNRQWGLAMQDDITDCVQALVTRGLADPTRLAIGGASYGGYAALQGVVKDPDQYKCAVSFAGISDLSWHYDLGYTDFNVDNPTTAELIFDTRMGTPSRDRALLEAHSPRLHVDRIKAPVLLVHGAGDRRVPLKHAQGMRDALARAGNPAEWLVFPEEGHGLNKAENWATFLGTLEAFFGKHLGA